MQFIKERYRNSFKEFLNKGLFEVSPLFLRYCSRYHPYFLDIVRDITLIIIIIKLIIDINSYSFNRIYSYYYNLLSLDKTLEKNL